MKLSSLFIIKISISFVLLFCYNITFGQKPQLLRTIKDYFPINNFSFSHNGKYLITTSDNRIMTKVWYLANGTLVKEMEGVSSAIFSADDENLIIVNKEKFLLQCIDLKTFNVVYEIKDISEICSFSNNYQYILALSVDPKYVKILNSKDGSIHKKGGKFEKDVAVAKYTPDGLNIVINSGHFSGYGFYDTLNFKLINNYDGDFHKNASIFSWDGNYIASFLNNQTIVIRDAITGDQYKILKGDNGYNSISFSPTGNYLVAATSTNSVEIWDYSSVKLHSSIPLNEGITSVIFTPDGNQVAIASGKTIAIYKVFDSPKK